MPEDIAKSGGARCLLMDLDTEKVVLDIERAVLQVEPPGDRCPFAERADDGHVEAIFAIGRRRRKIARRIAVHRHEPSARPQTNARSRCTSHSAPRGGARSSENRLRPRDRSPPRARCPARPQRYNRSPAAVALRWPGPTRSFLADLPAVESLAGRS